VPNSYIWGCFPLSMKQKVMLFDVVTIFEPSLKFTPQVPSDSMYANPYFFV
jgi:hypothetical protein